MTALPDNRKEILKFNRQYLVNVVYTILGEPFAAWTRERIEARNEKVTTEKELAIDMDNEIAEVFRSVSNTASFSFLFYPSFSFASEHSGVPHERQFEHAPKEKRHQKKI